MRYSSQGGITSKGSGGGEKDEEIHYRLRHLNTGRLVIDQEVQMNNLTMRTLGLCPHVVLNNLSSYSERLIDGIQDEMSRIDNDDSFEVLKEIDGKKCDYKFIDERSRFRIISTSPSLDDRIKSHSCVQIQHVKSEMFLSYETKSNLQVSKQTKHGDTKSHSSMNMTRALGEKLYCEVDDDDIQSGQYSLLVLA